MTSPITIAQAHAGTVACVTLAFNRRQLLRDCLNGMSRQSRRPDEIFVVDNASTDGTDEMMRSDFPDVTYRKLPKNIGSAGGYAEGLCLAFERGHDWVWLMDDDSAPEPNALAELLRPELLADPDVFAIGGTVLGPKGTVVIYHKYRFDAAIPRIAPVPADDYQRFECFDVDVISYSGILISRRAVEKVGLPLRKFFIYSDDAEYCLRMRRCGGRIVVVSASRMVNTSHPGAPALWRAYYSRRNALYMYKLHRSTSAVEFYLRILAGTLRLQVHLLRYGDHKIKSSRILWRATLRGLLGILGKDLDPLASGFEEVERTNLVSDLI